MNIFMIIIAVMVSLTLLYGFIASFKKFPLMPNCTPAVNFIIRLGMLVGVAVWLHFAYKLGTQ